MRSVLALFGIWSKCLDFRPLFNKPLTFEIWSQCDIWKRSKNLNPSFLKVWRLRIWLIWKSFLNQSWSSQHKDWVLMKRFNWLLFKRCEQRKEENLKEKKSARLKKLQSKQQFKLILLRNDQTLLCLSKEDFRSSLRSSKPKSKHFN